MADGPKPPKGFLITGIIFLVLAVAGCGVGGLGCTSVIGAVQDVVDKASTTDLGQETTFSSSATSAYVLSTAASPLCEGQDENGNPIKFEDPGSTSGTFTSGNDSYDLAYSFRTEEGGSYRLICDADGPGKYLVASLPSLGGLAVGAGGIGGGVLFFILGVIFLIIGLVKRSGWKKRNAGFVPAQGAPGAMAPPPPGGFAPTGGAPVPPPPGAGVPPQPAAPPMAPPPPAAPPVAPPPAAPPVAPPPPAAPPVAPPPPAPPSAPSPPAPPSAPPVGGDVPPPPPPPPA